MPDGHFPANAAQEKPCQIPQPQVSPADVEPQLKKGGSGSQEKEPVPQGRLPGAQGPEEPIYQSQTQTHQAADGKAPRGDFRGGHPSSRRSQPPCRGSSYIRALMLPSTAICPPSTLSCFSCSP